MKRRGLEISMANPVNKTISYQTHYVAQSGGEGRAGSGAGGGGAEGSPVPTAHCFGTNCIFISEDS